jgi:hypothetical protein
VKITYFDKKKNKTIWMGDFESIDPKPPLFVMKKKGRKMPLNGFFFYFQVYFLKEMIYLYFIILSPYKNISHFEKIFCIKI